MRVVVVAVLAFFVMSSLAVAAGKTYQVTGPVLEVKDDSFTVQKGNEKWEIARDKDTKVTGDLKVGAKVTVQYTMTAKSVEAKGGDDKKADKKADKKEDKKKSEKKK